MKKKLLGLGILVTLLIMLFVLTGCGDEKTDESDYISEIKNMHFTCDGSWYDSYKSITENYTVGELMESQLKDAKWSEETVNYQSCVVVEGTDVDNGKTYKVIFNKNTLNKNETLSPYYDIYVDGEIGSKSDFNSMLRRMWENKKRAE